jgi:hypothetical protein
MIDLTQTQAESTIYSLCVSYANTGEVEYIDTANLVATETSNSSYFRGVNKALSIIYPIPVEPVDPIEP